MNEAGDIYLGAYAGWYSVRDERFFTEDEIDGRRRRRPGAPSRPAPRSRGPRSRPTSSGCRPTPIELLAHYEAHPEFIGPDVRRNEVVSFVSGGLRDLSISRTTFDWGVPVPDHPDHVMYVWVDALTNYLTGVGFPDTDIASRSAGTGPPICT